MKNQFQYSIEQKRKDLLNLLQKNEEMFDETLGMWKIDPVYFELK